MQFVRWHHETEDEEHREAYEWADLKMLNQVYTYGFLGGIAAMLQETIKSWKLFVLIYLEVFSLFAWLSVLFGKRLALRVIFFASRLIIRVWGVHVILSEWCDFICICSVSIRIGWKLWCFKELLIVIQNTLSVKVTEWQSNEAQVYHSYIAAKVQVVNPHRKRHLEKWFRYFEESLIMTNCRKDIKRNQQDID